MDALYQLLGQIGYTHPLHPVLTHLPVGCIIAAFVFALLAVFFRNPAYHQTARHCLGLALVALPFTALFGYYDWRHYYAGASLRPIHLKMALAAVLFLMLIAALAVRPREGRPSARILVLCLICFGLVSGLGYFGGELVYGSRSKATLNQETPEAGNLSAGRALFEQKCAFCHYSDSNDTKVGPGLKGLFQRRTLPTSDWPLTEDNVRRQIVTPYETMPAFPDLTEEEMQALMDYLKSL